MQNDAMDIQEAEVLDSSAFKVNIKVLNGFFEMFTPHHYKRSIFMSGIRDLKSIQTSPVDEILARPPGILPAKILQLKYQTPAEKYFLMYFKAKENIKTISLHPNKDFKNKIEELQKKIDNLEKEKVLAKQEALVRIRNQQKVHIQGKQNQILPNKIAGNQLNSSSSNSES